VPSPQNIRLARARAAANRRARINRIEAYQAGQEGDYLGQPNTFYDGAPENTLDGVSNGDVTPGPVP